MVKRIKEFGIVAVILMLFVFCAFAATNDPWDGTKWNTSAPDIDQPYGKGYLEVQDLRKGVALRMNKEHETLATSSAGGVHKQGSARTFFQDAAPTTQIDGTAWDSGDRGSLWFDTNASIDNQFYLLTDHASTGTWTPVSTEIIAFLLASNRVFAGTLGVDGLITANGGLTLGAGDDLIGSTTSDINFGSGNFTVAGDTGNTVVGGTLDVTGNIDPTTYETTNGGFLDEDAMGSNAANKVASQQSIKAYVDAIFSPNPMTGENDSAGTLAFPNGFKIEWGKETGVSGTSTVVTFTSSFFTKVFKLIPIMSTDHGENTVNPSITSLDNVNATVHHDNEENTGFDWIAIGY